MEASRNIAARVQKHSVRPALARSRLELADLQKRYPEFAAALDPEEDPVDAPSAKQR